MFQPAARYLILPGWKNSGVDHWQSWWQQQLPRTARLQVRDWHQPQPEEWVNAIDRLVMAAEPGVIVIAHSLACVAFTRWAAQTSPDQLARVGAALLVAPADVERPGCPQALTPFAPIALTPLPFPAQVIGSLNDPAATPARVEALAKAWDAECTLIGAVGHINSESGHHQWQEGLFWLSQLSAKQAA